MPFLGEKFYHVLENQIDTFEDCNITMTNIEPTNTNASCYYKSHAIALYNDIKSLLQKTNIENIIYNDDTLTFNIFGFSFSIICFSNAYHNNSSYLKYYSIIPYCLFRNKSYNTNSTLMDTFKMPINSQVSNVNNPNDIANNQLYNSKGYLLSIINNWGTRNEVDYTLHLYYNTNFICLQYISARGAKIPLITLIQGHTQDNVNIIYACASCNSICSDASYMHYHTLYNTTADCEIYHNYYIYNRDGDYGLFDKNIFPLKKYLKTIGLNSEIKDASYTGLNKVYLNKLTACGGIITFDNIYDVTRINSGEEYESQFDLDTQYTINEENYYCPGDNFRYLTIVSNNNVTNAGNTYAAHRLLLKI